MPTDAVEQNAVDATANDQPAADYNTTNNDENSIEAKPFDLAEPFDLTFEARGRRGKVRVRHVLRRPTVKELLERDAAQPYRSRDNGEDVEEVLTDASVSPADVKLYNRLVLLTEGYRVVVADGQDKEARKSALDAVPPTHKQSIVGAVLPVNTKYVPEAMPEGASDEAEVFVWGEGLTYKFESEVGANGAFKVTTVMREPSEAQMNSYRARSTHFFVEKGARQPVTRVTVDLRPSIELFDALVESVDGFVVGGEAFDVKDKLHLQLIDPYFKRSVVDQLMKQTQLDLGK